MTPQVAERLLYESEAALRLVDSLLAELQEGDSGHLEDGLGHNPDERALASTQLVVDELTLLREDLAERRAELERPNRAVSGDEARLIAARVLRAAEERLDTLTHRLDLLASDDR